MRAFFFAATVSASEYPSYEEWLSQQNGKSGASAERKAIYNANIEIIKGQNRDGNAVFNVNEYADLTNAEWKQVRGIVGFGVDPEDGRADQCNFQEPDAPVLSEDEINELANVAVDWVSKGAVTPVKNQGSSGTCGYFSSITVMEGINVVQGGNDLVSLSEQEVLDCCTPGNGGCNGWPGQEIAWYGKNGGVMAKTEASYPYKGSSDIPRKDGTPCYSSSGTPTTATAAGRICLENNKSSINAHLNKLGPAVWMIDASPLQFYSSGIISGGSGAGSGGTWPHYNGIDHATTMVGSGVANGKEYWKVKNSWGKSWGESGYYRVEKDEVGASKQNLHAIGAIFGIYPSSTVV